MQTLAHEAMATRFEIVLEYEDGLYARQAAAEAFAELDRLEGLLSRYVEGSDVWRINCLGPGQWTAVAPETMECLALAEAARVKTAGAFDAAFRCAQPVGGARLQLDVPARTVRALCGGLDLDLGGIGKGYALDRMAAVLHDWDIEAALLCASRSTLLAMAPPPGEPGWRVRLLGDRAVMHLAHAAIGGSGVARQGRHIFDPRRDRPAQLRFRAWAIAPTGAWADALSTALMVMHADEIAGALKPPPASTGPATVRAFVQQLPQGPIEEYRSDAA